MERREFNRRIGAAALGTLAWASRGSAAARPPLTIDAERLRANLEALSRFGRTPDGGISRVAWTAADIEARRWVMEQLMAPAGLEVRVDPAGSIFGRRAGSRPELPVILFGSHLDSVTNGGRFDGSLGVLAAIEVLQTLADRKIVTRHPLECVVWSNEEGEHYGRGLFGSRAAVGEIDPAELEEKDEHGVPLREAVRAAGGDAGRLAEALIPRGRIEAYIELHIEQGGILDKTGIEIGVVEGIVGITRYQVQVTGRANHAGTTPMADRRDALVAASSLVLAVREETVREPGRQVGTVGRLLVDPNVPNVIPGRVNLVIELRDLSLETIESIYRRIEARARAIAEQSGTAIEMARISLHEPAPATPWVRDLIAREAVAAGFSMQLMPSGAGHDAQMVARIAPMGMIFVPSVGGVSHAPQELTRWEDAARGCEVLYRTVLAIDRR
jgi:N-carbamoyl-L-amino-acid hydrolase